jgi:hypothetical protein
MADTLRVLNRKQLSKIFTNHEEIRVFEELFSKTLETTPNQIADLNSTIDASQIKSNNSKFLELTQKIEFLENKLFKNESLIQNLTVEINNLKLIARI